MMKFLKILALLGLATLVSAPVIQAQDQTPPAQGKKGGRGGRGMMSPEQRLAAIDTAVTLTADQKPKVTAILEKAQTDMAAARDAAAGDRAAMMEKMQGINKQVNADIKALLTADQQKKFDDYIASQPAPGGRRGGKKQN
jgi:hypothetical protein